MMDALDPQAVMDGVRRHDVSHFAFGVDVEAPGGTACHIVFALYFYRTGGKQLWDWPRVFATAGAVNADGTAATPPQPAWAGVYEATAGDGLDVRWQEGTPAFIRAKAAVLWAAALQHAPSLRAILETAEPPSVGAH